MYVKSTKQCPECNHWWCGEYAEDGCTYEDVKCYEDEQRGGRHSGCEPRLLLIQLIWLLM